MSEIELEVFRAGDYGEKGAFTEKDLDAIASDYLPERHEAPVTIDHAQSGPAFGWVKSLRRAGNRLFATLKDLKGDFLQWLKNGAFKKRSIELYKKFSSTNRPYLRAVSFLGACPPEVKGLADPVFADGGDFVNLDWLEPDAARMAELLKERDELKLEVAHLRENERRAAIAAFCERLKRAGRLLPAWEERGLSQFMFSLDGENRVCFGESQNVSAFDWFCQFMETLPPAVNLREVEFGDTPRLAPRAEFPLEADGVLISPESLENHKRALELMERHPGVAYADALSMSSH